MNKVQTNTRKQVSMTNYVQYRNDVPLGAPNSLQNMLVRSLGAGTFAKFWQYWNPIWGYALGRYVYKPLNRILPSSVSLILTLVNFRWEFMILQQRLSGVRLHSFLHPGSF